MFEKMRVMFDSDFKEKPRFFENDLFFANLSPDQVRTVGTLLFARVGKIEHSHEGCACPMGAVAKGFLGHLEVEKDEWVLVDTEAGVEHFGRGLLEGADLVLIIVDPSYEAVLLARKAVRLADEAGKPFLVLLNKVDGESETRLREMLGQEGLEVLASLPYSPQVARANLSGEPLSPGPLQAALDGALAAVEKF